MEAVLKNIFIGNLSKSIFPTCNSAQVHSLITHRRALLFIRIWINEKKERNLRAVCWFFFSPLSWAFFSNNQVVYFTATGEGSGLCNFEGCRSYDSIMVREFARHADEYFELWKPVCRRWCFQVILPEANGMRSSY